MPTTNVLKAIRGTVDGDPLEIMVHSQASGGGEAEVTAGADGITAAGGSAQVTVVYTAAGDISGGMLVLTVPWDNPLMSTLTSLQQAASVRCCCGDFGGYYVADPDDPDDEGIEVPMGGTAHCQGGAR